MRLCILYRTFKALYKYCVIIIIIIINYYYIIIIINYYWPTNNDAARHRHFFRVQFRLHFDALTISKIGNYPTLLTDLRDSPFYFISTNHIRPRL